MGFNLDEEIIDGHIVTAETKKQWAVDMDLAQKLLDVCKKYNLKIWATDGTLLGAVRHKGFIPWDDDMDFCMMRDDYNKFIEIGPQEFKEPYFFQSYYTDEHFWGGMVKIRRSNTAMIEKDYKFHKDYNRGIFIDVFVLDAIPNDEKVFTKTYRKVKFLRRTLEHYRLIDSKYLSLIGKIRHALISLYIGIRTPLSVQKQIVKLLSKNTIADNDYCAPLEYYALEWRDISRVKFRKKSFYNETIMLPFHDMQIPAPKGFDALLKVLYGDYMKPVKGTQSHGNIVVDCERSYKDVLAELKNK